MFEIQLNTRMFIAHRKDFLIGDLLIDDRLSNGSDFFKGKMLKFGWDYEQKNEINIP